MVDSKQKKWLNVQWSIIYHDQIACPKLMKRTVFFFFFLTLTIFRWEHWTTEDKGLTNQTYFSKQEVFTSSNFESASVATVLAESNCFSSSSILSSLVLFLPSSALRFLGAMNISTTWQFWSDLRTTKKPPNTIANNKDWRKAWAASEWDSEGMLVTCLL